MHRRQLLAAAAALAASPRDVFAQASDDAMGELREAAREAWLYCLPLVEMATVRARATSAGGGPPRVNVFNHARQLAGPASRGVTAPNNDTLYSSAWIDLAAGPVTIAVPPTGARYFSLALMDMFTNNFAVLGTRTTGPGGGVFTLAGPGARAPADAIRAPTPWVWALGRTLVDGPADLEAVHAIQDGLAIQARAGRMPARGPGRDAPWSDYFMGAQQLLVENPPPAADQAFFTRIAPLQLRRAGGFERARFADVEVGEIQEGVADARAALRGQRAGQVIDGWTYPKANLGDFGQDYEYRAAVALAGLAALPRAEAMYMQPVAPDGTPLFRGDDYRLVLPSPPPADAFWSLSMYEATEAGQFFFTENPIGRYAIGDRTPGLQRGPNGEIEIWISRGDPGGAKSANWLPAPATGPFRMSLRAYLPRPALLEGRYRLQPLEPVIAAPAPPPAPAVAAPPPPAPRRRRRKRRR